MYEILDVNSHGEFIALFLLMTAIMIPALIATGGMESLLDFYHWMRGKNHG